MTTKRRSFWRAQNHFFGIRMRAKPLDSSSPSTISLRWNPICTEERLIYRNCSSDAINLFNWNSTHKVVHPILIRRSTQRRRETFLSRRNETLLFSVCLTLQNQRQELESVARFLNSARYDLFWIGTQRRKWRIQSTQKDIVTRRRRTQHALWRKTHHRETTCFRVQNASSE